MAAVAKNRDYSVILSPVITEKATRILENNQVIFNVSPNATKPQIKNAIEALFSVKVANVNTINIKGKQKIFRGIKGKRTGTRKAIVSLEKGQSIDLSSGV